jgi:hypothetical protein
MLVHVSECLPLGLDLARANCCKYSRSNITVFLVRLLSALNIKNVPVFLRTI